MDSLSGNVVRLLRRHWYVVVAALVFGALGARALGSTDVVSTEILHVASVEDAAKTLDLKDVPDAPVNAAALQAPENFKRQPDFAGLAATFHWDEAARSLTITVTGSSADAVRTSAAKLRDMIVNSILQPVDSSLTLAVTDQGNQATQLNTAAAAIDKTVDQLSADDPTRSALLSRATDLRTDAAAAAIRGASLESLRTSLPSLVTAEKPILASSSPGITTYVAGILVAGALVVLAACAWVLADRRIRRRIHIERAAPGVRSLGLVGPLDPAARQVDSVIVASINAFLRESGGTSVVFFGVPTADPSISVLAEVLQEHVKLPLVVSNQSAAQTVRQDPSESIAYVAVVRWGKTTEDQLSSAIADVRSVGGLAIATILTGVPDRERSWAGATIPDIDLVPTEAT
jgi:hypothetical protein